MATYKSLESLKAAILKEVRSAVDAAAQESKNVLQKNVDEFYSIPEGVITELNASGSATT
ncbi:MAG: hypothetical protein ACLTER_17790 [Ruminococcus sp.]